MSNDFVLTVQSTFLSKTTTEIYTKENYLESMKLSWAASTNYSYNQISKKILSLTKSSPSYYEVVVEKFTIDNVNYESKSENTIYLVVLEGKILAKKIESISNIKAI